MTKIDIWNFHFRNSTSGELLNRKWYRKLSGTLRCAIHSTIFQIFNFFSSVKIDWVIAILKFLCFLDLMTSSMTSSPPKTIHLCLGSEYISPPNLVKIGWKLWPVSSDLQTDRQTNKQTNRQTNILAKIEDFGK